MHLEILIIIIEVMIEFIKIEGFIISTIEHGMII